MKGTIPMDMDTNWDIVKETIAKIENCSEDDIEFRSKRLALFLLELGEGN